MRFSKLLSQVFLFASVSTFTGIASSTLVSYNESVDGNLGSSAPYKTFVFDTTGINSITGTANWVNQDAFIFTIADGLQLVGLSLEVVGPLVSWNLYAGTDTSSPLISLIGDGDSSDPFLQSYYQQIDPALLPLNTSTYAMMPRLAVSASGNSTFNSYTLNFTVEKVKAISVPEPGTLALIGAGLSGLMAIRSRRSKPGTRQ